MKKSSLAPLVEARSQSKPADDFQPFEPEGIPSRIPVAAPVFNGREKEYMLRCIETGWVSSGGEYIVEFERKFAEYCGAKHALTCTNGTAALHLPLMAKNIGPGDEVIVPTLTYIATANTVRYCNATPVFVDCDLDTWNISVAAIEKKITSRTVGILPVHVYGLPADMGPILDIAKRHGLFVLEDAAQAHGSTYEGKKAGTLGEVGTFSFFGNKVITTGEGGMVVTDDDKLADRMRLLRSQGQQPDRRYWFQHIGNNYRMTNVQAAIGLGQLENISWHRSQRQRVAARYFDKLAGFDRIELPVKGNADRCFWMFCMLLKSNSKVSRDELTKRLDRDGIETRPIFYPLTWMEPYRESESEYPNATNLGHRGICLPTHAALSNEAIDYIVERVRFHCGG